MSHLMGALLMLAVSAAAAQPAAPYAPAGDGVVLQKVPAASDPDIRRIAALRRSHAAEPGDARAADALARAYVDFGRKVGDAHYAGYAEAVIGPWMTKPGPPTARLNKTKSAIVNSRTSSFPRTPQTPMPRVQS